MVLGAMLLDNEAIPKVIEILGRVENPFYSPANRKVFDSIVSLYRRGKPADCITVSDNLGKSLEAVGEIKVVDLTLKVTSAANVEHHAIVLADRALQRSLIKLGGKLVGDGYEGEDPLESLERAESKLVALRTGLIRQDFKQLSNTLAETESNIIKSAELGRSGLPSGFVDLDKIIGGWQDSDLIIIAGRPSVGKTALAECTAYNIAKTGVAGGIFSLEMSTNQLNTRLISMESEVDSWKLFHGRINDEEILKVREAKQRLEGLPLLIDDTAAISIDEIRSKAKRMKSNYGIGFVVIDYLQLCTGSRDGNREQEISSISRGAKGIAKELSLPVILLSQLSRMVESRADRRPVLSDLRESGAIEQDSDVVVFVSGQNDTNWRDIIVAKQRNGPIGEARLAFISRYTKFANYYEPF